MKEINPIPGKILSIDAPKKIWVVPVSLSIYILCFPYLFSQLDQAAITFYFFPTLLAGLFLGRRWGYRNQPLSTGFQDTGKSHSTS